MAAYCLTEAATQDLINIRHYTLENWGQVQSIKYLQELEQTFELLAQQPKLGRPQPKLNEKAFNFQHAQHVIYYQANTAEIIIFAVLHQRMLPTLHLDERVKD